MARISEETSCIADEEDACWPEYGKGAMAALYLDGFSQGCYAIRECKTSLVVPDNALVERRTTGGALNVLNSVLLWGQP